VVVLIEVIHDNGDRDDDDRDDNYHCHFSRRYVGLSIFKLCCVIDIRIMI